MTAWRGWWAPTATASPPMTRSPSPRAADECLLDRLATAAQRACLPTIGCPTAAVVAGSGEFLARRLAKRVIDIGGPIVSLREAWGPLASSAGCAYALAILASERSHGPLVTPRQSPSALDLGE